MLNAIRVYPCLWSLTIDRTKEMYTELHVNGCRCECECECVCVCVCVCVCGKCVP
jgi:hypothetical protein